MMIKLSFLRKEEWEKLNPWQQGYASYTYSHWPNSTIPDESNNPYPVSTPKHELFLNGVQAAVLDAQDSEE